MSASRRILVVTLDRLPLGDRSGQLPSLRVERAERAAIDGHGTVAHALVRAGETGHAVANLGDVATDVADELRRGPGRRSWKVLPLEQHQRLGVPPAHRVGGELA